jgi:hypothetical protein
VLVGKSAKEGPLLPELACIYLSLTFMFQFLQTLVSHVSFSVVAVVLYLEPVQEALRMAKAVADSIQISVKSK